MLIWNKKHDHHDKDDPIAEGFRNASQAVAKYHYPSCPLDGSDTQSTTEDNFDDICENQPTRIAKLQTTPDTSQDSWLPMSSELLDESLWQRVLDDFTLLPPAPTAGFAAGAFAPYGYP